MSGNRDTGTLGHWVMHRPSPCWCYAKLLQLCPTLCNPIDGSPPGSPVPGILQARTLEWVAISFFNAWKWKVKVKSLSCVRLLAIPWTVAYQAPPSMGLSRQEYWSGVPLPSPLPHVGEHDFQGTLSIPVGCSPSFEQVTWKQCSRTTRFWRRGDLKMNVKAQARLWMKGAEERKKSCREWQRNGRDIYEVKGQLGGQGVPWDNNHKTKSEILVSDFWSRAVTGQDQSCSHGSWWLKLSRDLAHGCNEASPEPQNVRVTWAGPLFQFPPEELWKHFCQWRIRFWFTATVKSLLYSPVADTCKSHQDIVKVIILQLK